MGRKTMNFTDEEKRELLSIARKALVAYAKDHRHGKTNPEHKRLQEKGAAFVTITKSGALRGCIGHIEARLPLHLCVREMAIAAGFEDPRFSKIELNEIDNIELEISVLSSLVPVKGPEDIMIGRDGLNIIRKPRSGLLLPQVSKKYQWDAKTFLEETCIKAGLNANDWKEPDTKIFRFEADVFSEKSLLNSK